MKQLNIILCIILLAGVLLSACASGEEFDTLAETDEPVIVETQPEEPIVIETQPEPESEPKEEEKTEIPQDEPEPATEQEIEPQMASDKADVPSPPDSAYVFIIVDAEGKPVANVTATLQPIIKEPEHDEEYVAMSLIGAGGGYTHNSYSGADGKLYYKNFDGFDASMFGQGNLWLNAYHAPYIGQHVVVDLPSPSREVTVVWTQETPPASPPDHSEYRIAFRIVDRDGNPVAGLRGNLGQSEPGASQSVSFLTGKPKSIMNMPEDDFYTDESGMLYGELLPGWDQHLLLDTRKCTLILEARYDQSLTMEVKLEVRDPPWTYNVTWEHPLPPKERPPQATGLRIFVADDKGSPVEGVELAGSPYSKEYVAEIFAKGGDITDEAIILGPSDGKGYIRWDGVQPGTYELYGNKNDKNQKFELIMPKNKAMADVTLIWQP